MDHNPPLSGLPFHPCPARKRKKIQDQMFAVMECLNDSTLHYKHEVQSATFTQSPDRPHPLSKPTVPTQQLLTGRPRLSRGSSGITFDPITEYYYCQKCSISFETRAKGLKHASKEHNIQIQFPCNYCDMKFFSKYSLKLHMKGVKDEGGKHKCKMCNFKSCKKIGLTFHIESHPVIEKVSPNQFEKV